MGAWPVTGGTLASVILMGDTSTSRWGTDGLLPDQDVEVAVMSVFAIISATQTPDLSEETYKQGSGAKVGRSLILHGGRWEVSVRDRTDVVNWPRVGETVRIYDMANIFGYGIVPVTARVLAAPYKAASGVPGERDFTLEKITLIETGQ